MIVKYKKITVVLAIALIGLFGLTACSKETATQEETQEISVTTTPVSYGSVANTILLSGQVLADETVAVVPKLAGVVQQVKVSVGDAVSSGQTLFTMEGDDYSLQVKQAQASYDLALAAYQDAKRTYERMENLYNEGAISQSQLEQSSLAVEAANPAAAKAGLDLAKSQYNNTIVTAPMSGLVSSVTVTAGSIASQQAAAVIIVNIDKVKLTASVSESNVNKLAAGQEVQVTVASAAATPFTAKISSIAPSANQQTMTFPVEVLIDNPQHLIKPGMFGEIRVATDTAENALLVPLEALIFNDGAYQVYVVKNGVAHLTDVAVGLQDETSVQITSGLIKGDRVVISGQDQLQDGLKVLESIAGDEQTTTTATETPPDTQAEGNGVS